MAERFDAVVVGAGILGLAHAYHLRKEGMRTLVVERSHRAVGASIRNFGMIWPIGQPPGALRATAMRSREIWLEALGEAGLWHRKTGSLHLAYREDELQVLSEFADLAEENGYRCRVTSCNEALDRSPCIRREGLLGALWSDEELCVNPREVVPGLAGFLQKGGVEFRFGTAVSDVESGRLSVGESEVTADRIFICTGDDLDSLFPSRYASYGLKRTKLQMMKARPLKAGYHIQTHLCSGLTLGHYANFQICPSLPALLSRYEKELPEHVKYGIHVLVSQHENGDLTIGDSHEYGDAHDPFLREHIDRLILEYLDTFLPLQEFEITERWHGIYAKNPAGTTIADEVLPGVTIVTGVGGAGMTLSFGVAERTVLGV